MAEAKAKPQKFPVTVQVTKLVNPMILREHVGEIEHPELGKIKMSRTGGGMIFEMPDGVYWIYGIRDLADGLFEHLLPKGA